MNHMGFPPLFPRLCASVLLALLCAWPAAAAEGDNDGYEAALQLLNKGDTVEAAIALKNGLRADPRHVPSIVLLGEIYLDNGLWSASETAFRQALGLGADPAGVYPLLARSLLAQRRARDLLDELSVAVVAPERRPEIHALRGEAHLALGEIDDLAAEIAQADADTYSLQLLRISLALHQQQLDQAESVAQQLLRDVPYRTESWNAAASVAHAGGDVEAALTRYGRAIEVDARNGDARIGRMSLLVDLHRETEIGADLEFFAAYHPSEPRANYFRALFLTRQGDEKGAEEALYESLSVISQLHEDQLRGGNRTLLILATLAHYGLGQFNSVVERARAYLVRDPAHEGVRKLLADGLIRTGRHGEAFVELRPLLGPEQRDPSILVLGATAKSKLRDYEGASQLLEQAMRISNLPDIATRRANMEIGAGRMERGTSILRALLEENPAYGSAGIALVVAYMSAGAHQEAIATAQAFLRNDPENLAVRNLLGVALSETGQTDRAEEIFAACVSRDDTFAPAVVNLSRLYRANGRLAEAAAEIARLLEQRPASTDLLVERSRIHLAQDALPEALRTARAAHDLNRDDLAVGTHLVELLFLDGNLAAIDRLTAQFERRHPREPEALVLRARYLIRAGDRIAARSALKRMQGAAGSDLDWLMRVAELQAGLSLHGDAAATLASAAHYHPAALPPVLGQIESYLRANRAQDAARVVAASVRFENDPAFALLRGETYLANREPALALAAFDHPQLQASPLAAVRGSHALAMLGRLPEAEARLRSFLADHPDDAPALEALADLLLGTGRYEDATDLYQRLVVEQTDLARLHNNLAVSLERQDRFDAAIAAARRAVALEPGSASSNDTLGWVLFRAGRPADALPHLREANVRDWTDPQIRVHLARCLASLGRPAEALTVLREGVERSMGFAQHAGVAELIEELTNATDIPTDAGAG